MADTGWVLGTASSQQDVPDFFFPVNGQGWTDLAKCLTRTTPSTDATATYQSLRNGGLSKFLTITAPNLSAIPSGSTIIGVEVRVNARHAFDGFFNSIQLRKAGAVAGSNLASPTVPITSAAFTDYTFGGSATLWGTTWSLAEVQAATFGVTLQFGNANEDNFTSLYIESVEFRVHFTPPLSPPVVTDASASAVFGVGGTVQIVATNTPTGWSLLGSPPDGVTINSSGLVEWTGATPVGVHSITPRAVNGAGVNTGTLILTITSPVPAPVVTAASLTRVYGVSGTVQMSATNTPTSWALADPPAGVAINGTGLVTVAADAGVQTATITVTATNAGGAGTAALSLTITRAPLVVAANNKARLMGAANPTFDGTITGYVLGETASALTGAASFTATATSESPAGAYVITAAVGTLTAANYAFTFANGVLTVTAPIQPIPTAAAQETAIVNTPAETLTRTAAVRAAGSVPQELRVLYDALLGPDSDAIGIESRAAAFGRLLSDPRYAALTGATTPAPAPTPRPGVYLSNVPSTAVVGVDFPANVLTATDGRAELRVSISVSAAGRYQIPNVPTAYIVVHSLLAPFTLDVTVRRAAVVTGGIGPGGNSTPARLNALLTPAMRTALFGAQPSGVYAEAAALAESTRFDERLAGVLIALVRRIAALS